MKRNSNALQPAYPFEFIDQYQQKIIFGGLTKLEIVALEIFKIRLQHKDWDEVNYDTIIESSYNLAQQFCEYNIEKMID